MHAVQSVVLVLSPVYAIAFHWSMCRVRAWLWKHSASLGVLVAVGGCSVPRINPFASKGKCRVFADSIGNDFIVSNTCSEAKCMWRPVWFSTKTLFLAIAIGLVLMRLIVASGAKRASEIRISVPLILALSVAVAVA